MPIQTYLAKIQASFASGQATEHTYRPELRDLFAELTGLQVINEPKRSEHGAPDFIFRDNLIPMAYAEAKDLHISLEKIEKSEQLARYFGYAKLILTNGIEFRFYINGKRYGEPIHLATKVGSSIENKPDAFDTFTRTLTDFLAGPIDTIRSASHLAEIMGGKARRIRDNITEMLSHEDQSKYAEIRKLKGIFTELLVHDLDEKKFADIYAQTLVYGLFVARYHDHSRENFTRQEARDLVPKSNPLLRRFFDHIAGESFEKRIAYIVDELCDVFAHSDVHALMHGLYQKADIETHDPVIHFYEDFLREYDEKLRMERGVFYTPAPVVRFIVRSIDEILKTHFDLPKGLLDTSKIKVKTDLQKLSKTGFKQGEKEVHRVQLLDPATGTGTFLNEVIRFCHSKMAKNLGQWPAYAREDLVPRLHGFELMMASYTIAHLKLGLTLAESWVPDLDQRLQIYLTNSLEEGKKIQNDLFTYGLLESITDEARLAGEVKSTAPIMVVLGNPPYAVSSSNKSEFIEKLMVDYKKDLNERNIQPLSDDYIKFFRLAESLIAKNGEGIFAYISNNSFIDGLIHRQMRKHLRETFDEIYILDLHWSAKKKETALDGSKDENVFDIQQWVSINIFVKRIKTTSTTPSKEGQGLVPLARIYHCDLYGKRKEKYSFLDSHHIGSVNWTDLSEQSTGYFAPKSDEGREEYEKGFSVAELMKVSNVGVATGKDAELVQINKSELEKKYEENIIAYQYRPFDIRYTIFDKKILQRARFETMQHLVYSNIALLTTSQNRQLSTNYSFISRLVSDRHTLDSAGDSMSVFPLYLYDADGNRTVNFDTSIVERIQWVVGTVAPEDILDYIYAVLHSPSYRLKYREFLKIDFPRVPYPSSPTEFSRLVRLGRELRGLHLLEDKRVHDPITSYPIAGDNGVEKISFKDGKVFINPTQYFDNVPSVVWDFMIGGYTPAQKWLKDRKGRTLKNADIDHYGAMIVAMNESVRIMGEIS